MDLLRPLALPAAFLLLVTACAHGGAERETARTSTGGEEIATASASGADEADAEAGREISTDRAYASDPGTGTPEREASLKVIEEGKGYLIADRPREAAVRFERAARIDPTNGFAYYWLGRARAENGDRSGAIGVLEKAESLLGPYPEWRERAAELLASLQ